MQPSRIHHVGLAVSDLDLSVAWYREALGLMHESPPVCRGEWRFVTSVRSAGPASRIVR